jgi:hypothetical protein
MIPRSAEGEPGATARLRSPCTRRRVHEASQLPECTSRDPLRTRRQREPRRLKLLREPPRQRFPKQARIIPHSGFRTRRNSGAPERRPKTSSSDRGFRNDHSYKSLAEVLILLSKFTQ